MKYIVHKRFKSKAICGDVNLPALTECESYDGFITYEGKTICCETSENAYQHFSRNDDGMGMVRGHLTQSIQKALSKRDSDYQDRWDMVWEDTLCQKYKKPEHEDYWLWNFDFYNAPVEDLKYILNKIKEV